MGHLHIFHHEDFNPKFTPRSHGSQCVQGVQIKPPCRGGGGKFPPWVGMFRYHGYHQVWPSNLLRTENDPTSKVSNFPKYSNQSKASKGGSVAATNPIKTLHPIHQPINQQQASRSSERSHLKVDTRFCTTVEKQFLRAEKTPWNVRLVRKDVFLWGFTEKILTPSLPSPAPNQRIHLLVFLSQSCQSCTYIPICTVGKLPKNISLDKVSSSEFIWLNSLDPYSIPQILFTHTFIVSCSQVVGKKNQLPIYSTLSIPLNQNTGHPTNHPRHVSDLFIGTEVL